MFDMNGIPLPALPLPTLGPSKPEQILYNPIKNGSTDPNSQAIKIRNAAAPGSLLKVWEGTLDVGGSSSSSNLTADLLIDCQLFSVGDIR